MSTAPIRNTRTTRGLLSCGISTPNALRLPPAAAPRIQTMPKIIRVWYILTSLPGRCHRTYLRMPLRRKSDKAGHSADRGPRKDHARTPNSAPESVIQKQTLAGLALGQRLRHDSGHALAGAVLVGAAAAGQGELAITQAVQSQLDTGQCGVHDGTGSSTRVGVRHRDRVVIIRSEEHTSEL